MRDTRVPMLLSASRLVLAPLFVVSMQGRFGGGPGGVLGAGSASLVPLAIALVATATDFADGRLARRMGVASTSGALLDVAGDAAFVLCALASLAAAGVVVPVLPAAAAVALSAFAWSRRRGATSAASATAPVAPRSRRAPADALGHAAGVLNYGVVLAGSALPLLPAAAPWIRSASMAVAAANLAPLVVRLAGSSRGASGVQESRRPSSEGSPPRDRA